MNKGYNQRKPKYASSNDAIFGTRAIIESIRAGKTIDKLFIQKGVKNDLTAELVNLAKSIDIPMSVVPLEKLDKITRKNHQGAIAFVSPIAFAEVDNVIMECYEKGEDPFIIILDRITDVRNFGAICRTAEGAGVHAVVVPTKGAAQINADAMKTSAGALNHLTICRENNLKDTIIRIKESGIKVVAVSEKADKLYFQEDMKGPLALIMGSEEDGVSEAYWKLCDGAIKIPMKGEIESLNVSVATGIVLFEALRQNT